MSRVISFRDVSHLNYIADLCCDIEAGSSVLIVTSREEESTALTRLVTGLARPDRGFVLIDGQDVGGLDQAGLFSLRQQIGVVPSNGGLISNLKFWENITLPLLYQSGGIEPADEKIALEYLDRLGYAGNIMAMPAHLTLSERRVAAMVRVFLRRPRIVLYSNCIEGAAPAAREVFFQVTREFHTELAGRTSLYLTSSPDLTAGFPMDMIISLNESAETVSRKI